MSRGRTTANFDIFMSNTFWACQYSSMTDFTDPPTRGSSSTAFSKNGDSSIVCSIYSFYLILIHDLLLFSASYSEMRHCCRTANIVLNSVSGPRFAPFPVTDWQCEELHDKRSDSGVLNRTSEASLHWQLAKPAQCTNTQRLTSPCNIQKELQPQSVDDLKLWMENSAHHSSCKSLSSEYIEVV